MNYKPIIIVGGEPNSIFSEIFFKSLKIKKFKSPIILIASFLIKLEDNGPIIYTQKRSGFGGRIFTIYKKTI